MNKIALAFLVTAAVILPAHAGWDLATMNKVVDDTNVVLNDNCSGTIIDRDRRLVLTARHCITEQYTTVYKETVDDKGVVHKDEVRIEAPGTISQLEFLDGYTVKNTSYTFDIADTDDSHDLALVRARAKFPTGLSAPVACAPPVRGETEYAVGNPKAVLYATVSKGIVASVDRTYRLLYPFTGGPINGNVAPDARITQITSPIAGGSSGGAVYNADGALFGVTNVGNQAYGPLAFSVSLGDIRNFLDKNGVSKSCP